MGGYRKGSKSWKHWGSGVLIAKAYLNSQKMNTKLCMHRMFLIP